ncbi:MAG: DUF3225 domain-containing protein [Actinomycetales bacterium]|nr:DUF3225 domain-containing protein [Actinomycetales bacterium]
MSRRSTAAGHAAESPRTPEPTEPRETGDLAARPPVHLPHGAEEPAGLVEAVLAYEVALQSDDVGALDVFFAPGPDTLRVDAAGPLRGHDAIAAFRRARGGAPTRRVTGIELRPLGADDALVVVLVAVAAGGIGAQTQLWRRDAEAGWRIAVAHVAAPAPAADPRIWRVVGTPLVPAALGAGDGPLAGVAVAVKDLFEIAGHRLGVGNPVFLAEAEPATSTAPAVRALLEAGASVRGIAQTDEFAYSLAGANAHYGTPPNGAVPGALPGGSTSGPASAVALGQADLGLGSDTAGSIRVPASYQGLWGLRTTHGAVPLSGVWPLAPSFDTVGWIARDAATLRAAAVATLGEPSGASASPFGAAPRWLVAAALLEGLEPGVREEVERVAEALGAQEVEIPSPDDLVTIFRTVQPAEAWRSDGAWITAHPGAVAPDIAERFELAEAMPASREQAGRAAMDAARARIDAALGDGVLLVPSASGPAPRADIAPEALGTVRAATLRVTSLAGVAGRPALSAPVLAVPGPWGAPAPVGLCLVGPAGSDVALIDLAVRSLGERRP